MKYCYFHYRCYYPYHRERTLGHPQLTSILIQPAKKVLVFNWVFDFRALPCPSPRVWMPVNGPGSLGWEARLLGRTDSSPMMGTRRSKYLVWQAAFQGFALGVDQVFICSLLREGL